MRLSTFFSVVAFVIIGVSASMPKTPFSKIVKNQLVKRQAAECDAWCDLARTMMQVCETDPSCVCDVAVFPLLKECANCQAVADPSQFGTLQQWCIDIANECKVYGYDVGDPTLIGTGIGNFAVTTARVAETFVRPSSSSTPSSSPNFTISTANGVGTSLVNPPSTSSRGPAAATATGENDGIENVGLLPGMWRTKSDASILSWSGIGLFLGIGVGALLAGLL